MDYNKKLSIQVNSIESLEYDNNLIIGEYKNEQNDLVFLGFTVRKRFLIKEKQILIGEFKKFFEVDYPLPVALGVLQNEEVHKNPFQCQLRFTAIAEKKIKYLTEDELDMLS